MESGNVEVTSLLLLARAEVNHTVSVADTTGYSPSSATLQSFGSCLESMRNRSQLAQRVSNPRGGERGEGPSSTTVQSFGSCLESMRNRSQLAQRVSSPGGREGGARVHNITKLWELSGIHEKQISACAEGE